MMNNNMNNLLRPAGIKLGLLFLFIIILPKLAFSHALEPGFLNIEQQSKQQFKITWKIPQVNGQPMGIYAHLPDVCNDRFGPKTQFTGSAYLSNWQTSCKDGISGNSIYIEGLDKTATDVLVRYKPLEKSAVTLLLTPHQTSKILPKEPDLWSVVSSYLLLGVDHILLGIDHLLFVLALILLVSSKWGLIKTITAFTLAHSITLSAATLGYISFPVPPVEAIIALSIMFLALEITKNQAGKMSLTERKPWLVSFTFGLLHGLGFASALAETGLPETEIPAALLTFNIGVELGQLLFIAMVLITIYCLKLTCKYFNIKQAYQKRGITYLVYTIGSISSYWFIERVVSFWA